MHTNSNSLSIHTYTQNDLYAVLTTDNLKYESHLNYRPTWTYTLFKTTIKINYVHTIPLFTSAERFITTLCFGFQIDTLMAVSYTHLDVYKRQRFQ